MVPTIRDVAKRAGVSISTVSRVLNGSASVHRKKQELVREAADALGYSPNPAARSLLGYGTGGVGVLLPYIAGDFFSEFLRSIDRFTGERGLSLTVSSSHRSTDGLRPVLERLRHRVDGLIVMSTEVSARDIRDMLPPRLPVVFVNTEVNGADGVVAINADNRGGAYRLTEHLIGRGHRTIAFLSGPAGSYDAEERRVGYQEALGAHGLTPAMVIEGDFTMGSGEAAVPNLLVASPRPTAVFAANDDSAFGLLTGLRDSGLSVPEDVAIAGFDDSKLSQLAAPSLTTVRVPVREMGQKAIEKLTAMIDHTEDAPPDVILLPTQVVERDSTSRS